jgi:hypothetical protein
MPRTGIPAAVVSYWDDGEEATAEPTKSTSVR